jgi:hypothetical protein
MLEHKDKSTTAFNSFSLRGNLVYHLVYSRTQLRSHERDWIFRVAINECCYNQAE